MHVRRLVDPSPDQLARANDILGQAFANHPVHLALAGGPGDRLTEFFARQLNTALSDYQVWVASTTVDGVDALLVLVPPEAQQVSSVPPPPKEEGEVENITVFQARVLGELHGTLYRVSLVATHPDSQRRGLMGALVAGAVKHCDDLSSGAMLCANEEGAIRLYARNGFQEVARGPILLPNGHVHHTCCMMRPPQLISTSA